jgi:hypothetical protein
LNPIDTALSPKFPTFIQGNRNLTVRLDQEFVLGEKASEQHSMPMLVGALPFQSRYLLRTALVISLIAELATVSAQAIAKLPLVGSHARPGFVMMDRQLLFENFDGAFLAYRAGFPNSSFKLLPEFACKCLHCHLS